MNKYLIIFFLFLSSLHCIDIPPRPVTSVNDYAGVLTSEEKMILESAGIAVLKQSGVSIVTIIFQNIDNSDINDLAVRIFEKWGIGPKDTDEGILVLIAIDQRKWRIENGYGMEGIIPDSIAYRIGATVMAPLFKEGKYGSGIIAAYGEFIKKIETEKKITINLQSGYPDSRGYAQNPNPASGKIGVFKIIFFIIIGAFLIFTRIGRTILFYMLLSGLLGGRRGGGGGFGGGFGGSGGFGGGMSGGGGASGGW